MARINVDKTELVWPGKYGDDGRLLSSPRADLPFQVIETVNKSRGPSGTRAVGTASLFDLYDGQEGNSFREGWRNKLIWGDNLLVMSSLLDRFAGEVDLIYIDPPFATGSDFSFTTEIGETPDNATRTKSPSIIEAKAYRDTWGGAHTYLAMMYERLKAMRELLSEEGCIFLHCDWRMNSMLRVLLDEVFGGACFRNEIIWRRAPNLGRQAAALQLGRVVDTIYVYSKRVGTPFRGETLYRSTECRAAATGGPAGAKWDAERRLYFTTAPRGDYTDESVERLRAEGRVYEPGTGKVYIKYFLRKGEDGKWYKDQPVDTLWDDYDVRPLRACTKAELGVGYDTQKPEGLLSRIIRWAAPPGALVADFFSGSGTTATVAERLGRRWIACDLSRWAVHVTRKRLQGVEGCQPFDLLNLGRYERQYWSGQSFGDDEGSTYAPHIAEYVSFMLRLYGARPLTGAGHLHGSKGGAVVHVGAVDSPVTISELDISIQEALDLKQSELHILGWEWEMGLHDLVTARAEHRGVRLRLVQIPSTVMEQQAIDRGDVRFFELAYLSASVVRHGPRGVSVELMDFGIPNPETVPSDARSAVKTWSDYVDYWAVDWDFREDTFVQGWVTFRTHEDRSLALRSDVHHYDASGRHRILVKAVDIFGNDTTQVLDVEVR